MDSLNNLLSHRLNKLGLSKELQAAYIVSQANLVAKGRFQAQSFSRGILTIICPNSIAASELQFESQIIIDEINANIKPAQIKRFRYQIKS